MNALETTPDLPEDLLKHTDPEGDAVAVESLTSIGEHVVVLLSRPVGEPKTPLWSVSSDILKPIPVDATVDALWPAGDAVLALVEEKLERISLDGKRTRLIELPHGTTSVDATWHEGGVRAGAIVGNRNGKISADPRLYPSTREQVTLVTYTPGTGWVDRSRVPVGCRELSQSRDGLRLAWLEPTNVIPEEAQRGEFRGYEVTSDRLLDLTRGAGRAGTVLVAPNGSGVLIQANFTKDRPITTHQDLWYQAWDSQDWRNLTGGNREIEDFGWLDSGSELWFSTIDGLDRNTTSVRVDGTGGRWRADSATCASEGGEAYATRGRDILPAIMVQEKRTDVPQPESFSDIRVKVVHWKASDGLAIQGVLYESDGTDDGAPVIVRAHGGPAGDVEANLSEATRHRHLLRAGYRVFEPAFRGSVGFGDDFLGANIGCQGEKDLDDILTGMDRLVEMGIADADRFGIFGGSYGGYMTLRAVAVTDRFRAGVALYGFIENRRMTLETGDFTYEDEYIAPVTWPMKSDSVGADVFSHLHAIDAPTLLLHGDQDPICTLSQSQIVYGALEHRGVKTGLVVYPGEGHGFRKPENRRDCAQRTLAWFIDYLPV